MDDLRIMIILIEGEYEKEARDSTMKVRTLLLYEFGIDVSETDILTIYGLNEDYEYESRKQEYYDRQFELRFQ